MDNKQIMEALRMQPLTEEEKSHRHILGRLYGPIATCVESTRNGRKYNRELWEKALSDDIFKEKVATKSLFLELGHPTDREETDMTKVCACIPEAPKIIGDDLYAYVDILDTTNGNLLKKFIDYGFRPGISSRGSGDVMENDEVDPDTFFLETWDIVQLPAVKKARLNVCESLDHTKVGLKKALKESLEKASEEDRKIMKEALDNLDINVEEDCAEPIKEDALDRFYPDGVDAVSDEEKMATDPDESELKSVLAEAAEKDAKETDDEEDDADEEAEDEADEAEEQSEDDETAICTVGDLVKSFADFDKDIPVEFAPVTIDDKTYDLEFYVNGDDDKITLGVNCVPAEEDSEDTEAAEDELPEEENPEVSAVIDASSTEEEETEPTEPEEPAIDDGETEVMESLKDLIRQKDLLESKVKALTKAQAVSNAEAEKLNEELNRYKAGFARTSELASQATKAKKEVASLTEQLAQKNGQIESLNKKIAEKTRLTESINADAKKVKTLTEKLNTASENEKALTEQIAQYKQRFSKLTEQANSYKAKFTAVLNKYIESKAKMLGVKPSEITNRLDESFNLDDIDKVCNELLSTKVNVGNRLPFDTKQVKAKVNESVSRKESADPDDYDLSDLYALAGISMN